MPTFEDTLLQELITEANSPMAVAPARVPLSRKVLPIAAATALLGAGALTLAGQNGGASVAAPRAQSSVLQKLKPTINLTDVKAVLAATTSAMDDAAYARVVMHQDGNITELWVEPDGYVRRMKYTENGAVTSDVGFPEDRNIGNARRVNYATKTYEEHTADWYRVMTLTDFRTQLDKGEFAVVGQETVDGRAATHLRETRPGVDSNVWVDSDTFLPIKSTFSSNLMTDDSTWTWVDKADAKAGDFMPPVPDGFTKAN